ncbi:hypothetical protein K3495_g5477 [Podosphaera aphanis]|nr:hypothetical protein K3495_g5477 [Podosphaera aphanis]
MNARGITEIRSIDLFWHLVDTPLFQADKDLLRILDPPAIWQSLLGHDTVFGEIVYMVNLYVGDVIKQQHL